MYLISYLLLLSIIAAFTLSTDIFLPLENTELTVPIISNYIQDEIENIYITKMILNETNRDPICSLPKLKKIALCEQIFALRSYKSTGVYISYIGFSIASSSCIKKPLRFKTLHSTYLDDEIVQNMYPCHARHNPIRTSFIEDNYYSKFYVSSGPKVNSVIVYTHQYNTENEWYSIYEYLQNITLNTLPNKLIRIKEITHELQENIQVIRTTNLKELEYIYYQEMSFIPQSSDPVCSLNRWQKFALCDYIYNHKYYKNILNVTISKNAFTYFMPDCDTKRLVFTHPKSKNIYLQIMMPCYGRSRISVGNVLLDKYIQYFYISSGSRRNSVFVYIIEKYSKKSDQIMDNVHLFEMIENVQFRNIPSVEMAYEDTQIESWFTSIQIAKMMSYTLAIHSLQKNLRKFEKGLEINKKDHNSTKKIKKMIMDTKDDIKEIQALYNELNLDKELENLFSDLLNAENSVNEFYNAMINHKIELFKIKN